jgi:hypothetical protein
MTTFSYTGSAQSYVVPGGVTYLFVEGCGASGAGASFYGTGASLGGDLVARIAVTPGETLQVNVGGAGVTNVAGWNGGAPGYTYTYTYNGAGGGASDVRQAGTALSNRVVVAGGGGGAGGNFGGVGGGLVGGSGGTYYGTAGGTGGTQSAGGGGSGVPGTLGVGGGYGGGGGYWGGGGAAQSLCAGGGSSFSSGLIITNNAGTWSGNGQITVTPILPPNAPVLSTPTNGQMEVLSGTPTFSWIYQSTAGDGAQYAYAFRRKIGAGAYSYWNATTSTWGAITWNTSSASSVTFPAAAWSDSSNYLWSVATQEYYYGYQSPFASDFTVNGQVAPTVTVTAPTATVFVPNPTITWTDTVAGGTVATGYRVIVYNAAQYGAGGFVPGVGPNAWDSGNVQPFVNTLTLPAYAIPNGTYRAYVQVVETNNVASAWGYSGFSLSIDLPAAPSLTATAGTDPVTGAPLVTVALQAHDNLLSAVDASAETSVGSWVGTNATLSRSATQSEDGTYSLKLVAVASGAMSAVTGPYVI